MDYARTFTSTKGRFVRFRLAEQQFLIERGKGPKLKSQDIFPVQTAIQMATQILQVTGQYMSDQKVVNKAVRDNTLTEEQAVQLLKTILDQSYDEDKLRQQAQNQLGTTENPSIGRNIEAIVGSPNEQTGEGLRIAPKYHTKWVLLQHLYDQYGFEPFSPRAFKEWFGQNHGSEKTAETHLRRFYNNNKLEKLSVEEVGDSEYKYQKVWYKLNRAEVAKFIEEFDGFAVPQNPYYTENPAFAEA